MKEYLVQMQYTDCDNIFIVMAQDSKDAINQVFEKHFKDKMNYIFAKSGLVARSIGSLHNEFGKVVSIN